MIVCRESGYSRKKRLIDLLISLLYTGLILGLIYFRVLKPIPAYTPK